MEELTDDDILGMVTNEAADDDDKVDTADDEPKMSHTEGFLALEANEKKLILLI